MHEAPPPPRPPSPRRLFAVAAAAALVAFALALSYGFADHDPAPHGLRIAVSAPAGLEHELSAGLAHADPGGFTLVPAASAQSVTAGVRAQSEDGGVVGGAA